MTDPDIKNVLAEYASKYPPLLSMRDAAAIAARPVGTVYDWSSRGYFNDFKKSCGRERRLIRDRFVLWLMGDGRTEG